MKATDFEYRHQLLLHELIVGAAILTYLLDRDDIVWRFIKGGDHVRPMERWLFAVTTLLFGVSAYLCTLARASVGTESAHDGGREGLGPFYRLRLLGDFLYAVALATLMPLSGFCILMFFESIRLLRLSRLDDALTRGRTTPPRLWQPEWGKAFRREAIKWGLFLTMIVFTATLKDRIAEVLIGATVILWILLNLRLSGVRSCLRVCLAGRRG
jgi:hypothetical protein